MYAIHTTPGFIIDTRPYGEAGKVMSIFTRDLGLILATAQGIRLEKSKLRYHARDYSFGIFSFVRGKEFWRLTSAQSGQEGRGKKEGGDQQIGPAEATQELLARFALLLKRLLHGEEPNEELFDVLEACYTFLSSQSDLGGEQMKTLESLVVLRMLHLLGYVGKDAQLAEYFLSKEITVEHLDKAAPLRQLMNQHINKALKESQL
jgi:recombinational DNA repair protein (RecF pathway)